MQRGVPASQAFAQAFPNGVPTAQQRAAEAAGAGQKAEIGKLAGLGLGALGTRGVYNWVTGKPVLGDTLTKALGVGGTGDAAAGAATVEAAPAGTFMLPGGGGGVAPELAPTSTLANVAPYLGVAGAGLGAYGLYQGIKDNSPKEGAIGGAGMGAGIAAALPLLGFGPVGWGALALSALGGGVGGGLLASLLGHKTTKQYEKERWGDLANSAQDAQTKAYAQQYQNYLNSDQQKIDAQPQNRLGYKMANGTLRPEDVWGSLGVMKTFGSDWLGKYNEDQRRNISQALIGATLFQGDHGDTMITDQDKARAIAAQVLGGNQTKPAIMPQAQAQQAALSAAYQKAALKQTGQFGNQLFNALR